MANNEKSKMTALGWLKNGPRCRLSMSQGGLQAFSRLQLAELREMYLPRSWKTGETSSTSLSSYGDRSLHQRR